MMSRTSVDAGDSPAQDDEVTGVVPARFSLEGEWDSPGGGTVELYLDHGCGDGCLLYVDPHSGEEAAATLNHAEGLVESTRFVGTSADRPEEWQTYHRRRIVASVATSAAKRRRQA